PFFGSTMMNPTATPVAKSQPWNKGKIIGQKAPLKAKDIWSIRVRLQMQNRTKELALFNLGFDSKLRACDLVSLRVGDICHGTRISNRATVMQRKTKRPVQSKSRRRHVRVWTLGSARQDCGRMTISS